MVEMFREIECLEDLYIISNTGMVTKIDKGTNLQWLPSGDAIKLPISDEGK